MSKKNKIPDNSQRRISCPFISGESCGENSFEPALFGLSLWRFIFCCLLPGMIIYRIQRISPGQNIFNSAEWRSWSHDFESSGPRLPQSYPKYSALFIKKCKKNVNNKILKIPFLIFSRTTKQQKCLNFRFIENVL